MLGRNETREPGRWVARDSARDAAERRDTVLALDDGLADALDGGRVDALEDGLTNGLALPWRTEALEGGLRWGCMLMCFAILILKQYRI